MRRRGPKARARTMALAVLGTAVAVPLTAGFWLYHRDPLGALPRAGAEATVEETQSERGRGRERRRVVLDGAALGSITVWLSLPRPMPDEPMPVVLVLGGLGDGRRNLCRVPDIGANVLVAYDWPIGKPLPQGMELWRSIPELYRRALAVPGQLSAALKWAGAQPWADKDRISLVGLSLGALAAPAVQRVAAAEGIAVKWTVLGFGGSPFASLLANHPDVEPAALRAILGAGAGLLMRPLEPAGHLPHLEGRFLVFAGSGDTLVPAPAARRYGALVPEPKSVRWLESAHLGVGSDSEDLLARVVGETVEWLEAQGAIEMSGKPPARSPNLRAGC